MLVECYEEHSQYFFIPSIDPLVNNLNTVTCHAKRKMHFIGSNECFNRKMINNTFFKLIIISIVNKYQRKKVLFFFIKSQWANVAITLYNMLVLGRVIVHLLFSNNRLIHPA